jgi:DNA mismatch repair protein MutS2
LDDRSLEILEFPKIRQALAGMATWALGREKALGLEVLTSPAPVGRVQEETAQAKGFLQAHPGFRLGGVRDVRGLVGRVCRGAILEPMEILDMTSTALASRRARGYLGEHGAPWDILEGAASGLYDFPGFPEEVSVAISQEGAVKDEASPDLGRVRSLLRSLGARLKERLESMVRSPEFGRYLQEPIVTIREDRYVVPVKMEHRGQVPGIVHDQSSSGATLFIEPEAIVSMNNEIRRLQLQEVEEVRRVLRRLSGLVAKDQVQWEETLQALGRLDFAFAKARLALEMGATRPYQDQEPRVRLLEARHPLLGGRAVPIDIQLGQDFDILVVTGPNTGGKTVSLKTVGLLCLMHQAGLQVPARDGSCLGVFNEVLCDIGDEQSIEQSLSTFSSHMNNICRFIGRAGPGVLILMDEMGAGTDPAEGSSLAMAILDHLGERGARVLATTHYSELKTYAFQKPRVENAAMEFDPETLLPTFRLIMGLPGRSNAFEISRRLGLPECIVEAARGHLGAKQSKADSLIRQMEDDSLRLHEDCRRAAEARVQAERAMAQAEAEAERVRAERERLVAKAREEAESLVRKANREVRQALKELRKAQKEHHLPQAEGARERLASLQADLEVPPEREPGEPPADLRVGDQVQVVSVGVKGTVVASPDQEGLVLVEAGAVRVRVPLDDLREAKTAVQTDTRERAMSMAAAKVQAFSPELDLRGLTSEEALFRVDKYLDDAHLAGAAEVRIIHGKGTGALKKAVAEHLGGHAMVASFRPGGPGEGGDGVTVARLE